MKGAKLASTIDKTNLSSHLFLHCSQVCKDLMDWSSKQTDLVGSICLQKDDAKNHLDYFLLSHMVTRTGMLLGKAAFHRA